MILFSGYFSTEIMYNLQESKSFLERPCCWIFVKRFFFIKNRTKLKDTHKYYVEIKEGREMYLILFTDR